MKLNIKKTILVGLAFLSICTFWQMYDNEIPLILENSFHLSPTLIGVIMALDNVMAVVLLPVFGSLSDHVDTKHGRRTPFIAVGTILAAILLILLAAAASVRSLPMFVVVLLLLLLAMSSYRSPAVALMPDVTPKPLRSQANAIINLMGTVGAIIALVLIPVLGARTAEDSYLPLFAVIAAVMVAALAVLLLTVDENSMRAEREKADAVLAGDEDAEDAGKQNATLSPEVRRSLYLLLASVVLWFLAYNAVTTAFSRFYQDYWGLQDKGYSRCLLVGTCVAVLAYIPAGRLATLFGRRRTIQIGVTILALSFLTACFFHTYTPGINVVFGTVGIGWAFINVNSYPMVVEMSGGADIGRFTGFYYTASMSAQIVTPILSGWLIERLGYTILFPYAVFFAACALVTISLVRHGDAKAAPLSAMEQLGSIDND